MKKLSALKYFSILTVPALAFISFRSYGWVTYLPIIENFFLVPFLELFLKPDASNLTGEEEELRKKEIIYDLLVYLMVPIQWFLVGYFLFSMQEELDTVSRVGRIMSMGLLCGVLGINVAHELGHRKKLFERRMSKILLLSSFYMHFYIEHNRGHHKRVSTREDPSSARMGETLYMFWLRSGFTGYLSAWKLERDRLRKKGKSVFSFKNEMIWFQLIQIGFLSLIVALFGWNIAGYYLIAAGMGGLLLETVNYIEHYGLERAKTPNGYERVKPHHSWNSDHTVGRIMLFELSRHSDHHYVASRKFQVLRHMDDSLQMPTGYPGMMILATIPLLWFKVMDAKVKGFKETR